MARLEAIPFGHDAEIARQLERLQNDGDFERLCLLLDELGRPYAFLSACLIFAGMVCSWSFSCRERYAKTLTMQALLHNNVHLYPCLAPILAWVDPFLMNQSIMAPG